MSTTRSKLVKKVYVCGSFRFTGEIENVERLLNKNSIEHHVSKSMNNRGILGCLKKIDEADVVYVVDPEGYVGKSVSVDIGYAYAKEKPVYVMRPIVDPPLSGLISGILSPKELIDLLEKDSHV
jgi:nucleoside 2-deoxyribosyltransferase